MINLKKCKIGYTNKIIFNDLDLNIKEGIITGILGTNGCGKTTLLTSILGSQKIFGGSIEIFGKDIKTLHYKEIAKQIAVVSQLQKPTFDFNVFDVILMGRNPYLSFKPSKEDMMLTQETIKKIGIEDLSTKSYKSLSGGERQMVNIARAVNQRTPIIAMDEPTSYLDLKNQSRVMNLVKQLNEQENKSIVMILHDPSHAIEFCHEVIFVEKDNITKGTSEEMITPENIKRIYGINSKKLNINGEYHIVPLLKEQCENTENKVKVVT